MLNVTIPANMTARILITKEYVGIIDESGMVVWDAETANTIAGIERIYADEKNVAFDVTSGVYHLTARTKTNIKETSGSTLCPKPFNPIPKVKYK